MEPRNEEREAGCKNLELANAQVFFKIKHYGEKMWHILMIKYVWVANYYSAQK